MGAWGQKAFENDSALDWLGDLHKSMRLEARIQKDIKQKKYAISSRAAIEYMIRSHKAGLFGGLEFEEITPLAIQRIDELKAELSDPQFWAWDSKEPIPKDELKEIQAAIRKATADLDGQLKYILKDRKRREDLDKRSPTISKSELSRQFEKLKKRIKKKRKGKSMADVSPRELADAYAKIKAEQRKKVPRPRTRKKK